MTDTINELSNYCKIHGTENDKNDTCQYCDPPGNFLLEEVEQTIKAAKIELARLDRILSKYD